jgi:MHS family shikimate/dehydroshikimate transporter-like MFS transporter
MTSAAESTTPDSTTQVTARPMGRVAASVLIGTTIEWYDFILYGSAAALVLGPQFFPGGDPVASTLLAFSTFAVGFLARPLGGIVLGHFGDRVGRKQMLVLSLSMMGVATFLMGLLPTYESIGVAAPILLVLLRLVQGFGVGGEWGGAVLTAVEHSSRAKRGYYGSLPVFEEVKANRRAARVPLADAMRRYPRQILLATGSMISTGAYFYIVNTYALSYASTTKVQSGTVMLVAVLVYVVASVMLSISYGPQATFITELFDATVRFSASTVSFQLGVLLGGAIAPLIAAALVASTGTSMSVAGYVCAVSLLSLVCVALVSQRDIARGSEDMDRELATA